MKTFRRTFLPEELNYNGNKYTLSNNDTRFITVGNMKPETIIENLRYKGKKGVLVEVLSRRLAGVRDL